MNIYKFILNVMKGKTIGRILFNNEIEHVGEYIKGKVFYLASGEDPSYVKILPNDVDYTATDYKIGSKIDQTVYLNKHLPFDKNTFDTILLFNAIYILEDIKATLNKIIRVLRPQGVLLLSSPFITNEMSEPHDYSRLTSEGLMKILEDSGFNKVIIKPYGERWSSAVYLINPFFLFNFVRIFIFSMALFLDTLIPKRIRNVHPAPIGYFVIVKV